MQDNGHLRVSAKQPDERLIGLATPYLEDAVKVTHRLVIMQDEDEMNLAHF